MKGFTLIELIIVIILVSILSALGVGVFSGTDGFSARVSSDLWLTSLRLSQRLALMKQNSSQLVSMGITQSSDNWNISVDFDGTQLNSFDVERNRVDFHSSTSDFASSCDALPDASFPMTFYFDGYGDFVNSSRVQLLANTRLCFAGGESVELCISPSGYAYAGTCQP
jgi:MSHA pilin protein MshC